MKVDILIKGGEPEYRRGILERMIDSFKKEDFKVRSMVMGEVAKVVAEK